MTVRDKIVAGAQKWLGTPYVWGGESEAEGGVDCSGLVIAAYKAAGVPLKGRPIASDLGKMGTPIPIGQAQPGDLIYYDKPGATDHVGIYIGANQMIDAPYTGASVRVDPVGSFTSVRRILDSQEGGGAGESGGGITFTPDGVPIPAGTQTDPAPPEGVNGEGALFDLDWGETALKLLATAVAGALIVAGVYRTVTPAS